jgi:hypothetical protein
VKRRHLILSSTLLTLICASPVFATDPPTELSQFDDAPSRWNDTGFDLVPAYYAPKSNFLDSVTMIRLPPGSLKVRYEGLHKLILRQANNQFRRFVRKYETPDDDRIRLTHWNNKGWSSNEWWQRSWMDSLPSAQGGAPDEVYVHTIGSENEWSIGPLSITNTLKIKLDYIAVLRLNTDPTTPEGEPQKARIAVDIYTPKQAVTGTQFKFKVRPHIRIALLKAGDWAEFFKTLSLRAELDVIVRGKRLVKAEAELRYKDEDLRFEINLELVSW